MSSIRDNVIHKKNLLDRNGLVQFHRAKVYSCTQEQISHHILMPHPVILSLRLRPHDAISTQQIHVHLRIARAVYTMHPEDFKDLMYPLIFYPLSSNHMLVARNRCVKIKHSESLKEMCATRRNLFAS